MCVCHSWADLWLCVFNIFVFVEVGVLSPFFLFFFLLLHLDAEDSICRLGTTGWKESVHYHMEKRFTANQEHSQQTVIRTRNKIPFVKLLKYRIFAIVSVTSIILINILEFFNIN